MEVQKLEKAVSLNQLRIEAIQWYESRLSIKVPESETIKLASSWKVSCGRRRWRVIATKMEQKNTAVRV